jgi:hypothetical protein
MKLGFKPRVNNWLLVLLVGFGTQAICRGQETPPFFITNGAAVYAPSVQLGTNYLPPYSGLAFRPPPMELPPEIRRALLLFQPQAVPRVVRLTNAVFSHYLQHSLENLAWTNLLALTNGRNTVVWSVRLHTPNWPRTPPQAGWNTNGLMWGMEGLTALSPCWEGEGFSGQVPITALTRRHGYTRGHGMGPAGFRAQLAGKKVWFLDLHNQLIEARIAREVVRTLETCTRDYTIVLFDRDLPATVHPLPVTDPFRLFEQGPNPCYFCRGAPVPLVKTEQGGQVGCELPGFNINTWKGGDSGSPNMLPLPGQLVFVSGRSTSGASAEMQADMDQLCRLQGLNPATYQMQWVKPAEQ